MSSWEALTQELACWHAEGKQLTVWWRDDDACAETAALKRLLTLVESHRMPLLLAVIPARLQTSLTAALAAGPPGVFVSQHGYAHENHAAATSKKMELCARPFGSGDFKATMEDLAKGAKTLAAAMNNSPRGTAMPRRLPVLVPPWNRIDHGLIALLPGLGFEGLSTFGPCPQSSAAPLAQVNCHLDIFQWKPSRRFRGETALLAQLTDDLRQRRTTESAQREPYGLLTHHLVHDNDCWTFLDRLFSVLRRHPALRFPDPTELFPATRNAVDITLGVHGPARESGRTA